MSTDSLPEPLSRWDKLKESIPSAGLPVAVIAILVTNFIDYLGTPLVEPALPFYMRGEGVTPLVINEIAAVYSLMQIIFGTILGRLSDRIGRKSVLLLGLFGESVFYFVMGWCTGVQEMFAVRAALGLFGSTGSVTMSYLYDCVDSPEVRKAALRWNLLLRSGSTSMGLMIGSVLYAAVGWQGVCNVFAAVCFSEVIVGSVFWKSHSNDAGSGGGKGGGKKGGGKGGGKGDGKDPPAGSGSIFRHFVDRRIGPLLLWQFLGVGASMFQATLAFTFMDKFELEQKHFARFQSGWTLCMFLSTSFLTKSQLNRFGEKWCMTLQPLCYSMGLLLVVIGPAGPTYAWVICWFYLCPCFGSAQQICMQEKLEEVLPERRLRGEINGLYGSINSAQTLVGFLAGGAIYQINPHYVYLIGMCTFWSRIFIVWGAFEWKDESQPAEEPLLPVEQEQSPTSQSSPLSPTSGQGSRPSCCFNSCQNGALDEEAFEADEEAMRWHFEKEHIHRKDRKHKSIGSISTLKSALKKSAKEQVKQSRSTFSERSLTMPDVS